MTAVEEVEPSTKKKVLTSTKKKEEKPDVLSPGLAELKRHIMANVPLIYTVTHEEDRLIREFRQHVGLKNNLEMVHWSAYTGLVKDGDTSFALTCNVKGKAESKKDLPQELTKTNDPRRALEVISQYKVPEGYKGAVFFMKDMHTVFSEPIPRQLRDTLNWLAKRVESPPIILVIVAPELGYSASRQSGLPMTIEKDIVVVNYDLLGREEIETIINRAVKEINSVKSKPMKLDKDDIQSISRAAQGMTFDEIRRAIALSVVETGSIDVDIILHHKKQAIKKSEVLEIVDIHHKVDEVGGLECAKEYFEQFKTSFSDEAKAYGVDTLDGVIMTGIPGTGKSALCHAIADMWQLPMLRLDIGKVMGSLVGQSEGNMRKALKQAEACAPCILWVDEIEKALSGTGSSNHTDGGTTARVFGTLLTWMQENEEDVVILATANAIDGLPPELIRRFNEVFFVDIPAAEEREEIFKIHLSKRGRDPKKFDLKKLVEGSPEYTGAEIEKAVKEGIANAFTANAKDRAYINSHK